MSDYEKLKMDIEVFETLLASIPNDFKDLVDEKLRAICLLIGATDLVEQEFSEPYYFAKALMSRLNGIERIIFDGISITKGLTIENGMIEKIDALDELIGFMKFKRNK